jgi:hypothetical protein
MTLALLVHLEVQPLPLSCWFPLVLLPLNLHSTTQDFHNMQPYRRKENKNKEISKRNLPKENEKFLSLT